MSASSGEAAMKGGGHAVEASHSVAHCPDWLVGLLEGIQTLSDLVGMAAIALALITASVGWLSLELRLLLKRGGGFPSRWKGIRAIRVFLGNYILLGLEFMIVSDIIHSFLQPDLESLSQLGLLVLIRTGISFFLGKELEAVHHEEVTDHTPPPETPAAS